MVTNKSTGSCSSNVNKCIECTVKQCKFHCDKENYCSLDKIVIGTHEANPTVPDCTDCTSFVLKG